MSDATIAALAEKLRCEPADLAGFPHDMVEREILAAGVLGVEPLIRDGAPVHGEVVVAGWPKLVYACPGRARPGVCYYRYTDEHLACTTHGARLGRLGMEA